MKNKEQLELYKNLNEQNSLRDVQKYVNKVIKNYYIRKLN